MLAGPFYDYFVVCHGCPVGGISQNFQYSPVGAKQGYLLRPFFCLLLLWIMGEAGKAFASPLQMACFFPTDGKERLADMTASADRAFPRLCQPFALVKYEPALPALGRNHVESQACCVQRSANMLQVTGYLPLGNPHLPGDIQGSDRFIGKECHDRVADRVVLLRRDRWFFRSRFHGSSHHPGQRPAISRPARRSSSTISAVPASL